MRLLITHFRDIILDDPSGPDVIRRKILKSRRGRQRSWSVMECETQPSAAGFKRGGRGHMPGGEGLEAGKGKETDSP